MEKQQRQKLILSIIKTQRISNQLELVQALEVKGVVCTQASISRDLSDLKVGKVGGAYKTPDLQPKMMSPLVGTLSVDRAGDHLIVIRTGPGSAQAAALIIDRAKIGGIVGTVAGDDTIFIAVKTRDNQNAVIKDIHKIFGDL